MQFNHIVHATSWNQLLADSAMMGTRTEQSQGPKEC